MAYRAAYKVKVYAFGGSLDVAQYPARWAQDAPSTASQQLRTGGDAPPDTGRASSGAAGPTGASGAPRRWRVRSHLRARGIASLFVRGDTVEDSIFEVDGDRTLRPVTVSVDDPIGNSSREVHFEWSDPAAPGSPAGHAEGVHDGEAFAIPVPRETLDRSLLIPAISLDLSGADITTDSEGRPQLRTPLDPARGYRFTVLERGKLRSYFARLLGTETVDGPDGPLETLVFEHQRQGSSRATTFWLAPALGYVPARIEQRKDDKNPHLRAWLKDFEIIDSTTIRSNGGD